MTVSMWDHPTPRNLIDLQRMAAVKAMGQRAKELYDEGYYVDGDRVLDELNERRRQWRQEVS